MVSSYPQGAGKLIFTFLFQTTGQNRGRREIGMYPFSFRMSPGFPGGVSGKESACQCRRCKRHEFDAWVGKSLWRRKCNPLQYSCLGNPMDRGAWWASPPVVEESDEAEHTCPLALEGSTRRLSLQSLGHTLVACPHLAPREARERVFPSL